MIVLGTDLGLSAYSARYGGTGASDRGWGISPSFDYFVAEHISLGVLAGYSSLSTTTAGSALTEESHGFGLGPRLGFDLPIGEGLSLYGRLGIVFGMRTYRDTAGDAVSEVTGKSWSADLAIDTIIEITRHLFLGAGPRLIRELSLEYDRGGANRSTRLSFGVTLGGWL